MVWFHGGGYVFGTTNDYRANYFMDEDVVLILVNYRLAALGKRFDSHRNACDCNYFIYTVMEYDNSVCGLKKDF